MAENNGFDKLAQMKESLGILSETLFMFYKTLLATGFEQEVAESITIEFMVHMLPNRET